MANETIIFATQGVQAILLAIAAVTDWRSRIIENWLNLGIALLAPVCWWASGMTVWPDMAIQTGIALITFALFIIPFALRAMGGGDVKLIGALALWFPFLELMQFLTIMSLIGGALTLAMLIRHKLQKAEHPLEIPYGVAIALAGLWTIYERNINHFG